MCELKPKISAYAQSDQSLCLSLEYSTSVTLLTEQCLELLSLKGAAQARLKLRLSKCHIVGNHMSRLNYLDKSDLSNIFKTFGPRREKTCVVC